MKIGRSICDAERLGIAKIARDPRFLDDPSATMQPYALLRNVYRHFAGGVL